MLQFPKGKLFMYMPKEQTLPLRNIRYLIREALTKSDKTEIKTIVRKELESELKAKLSKAVEEEVAESA